MSTGQVMTTVQVLRRFNEAIALDYAIPYRTVRRGPDGKLEYGEYMPWTPTSSGPSSTG